MYDGDVFLKPHAAAQTAVFRILKFAARGTVICVLSIVDLWTNK